MISNHRKIQIRGIEAGKLYRVRQRNTISGWTRTHDKPESTQNIIQLEAGQVFMLVSLYQTDAPGRHLNIVDTAELTDFENKAYVSIFSHTSTHPGVARRKFKSYWFKTFEEVTEDNDSEDLL